MEKTLSPDERIRRAEEIYYKKRINPSSVKKDSARVNVGKNISYKSKLVNKMILQFAICICIYFIVYIIQNTNYYFTPDIISNAKIILSYDSDLSYIYSGIKEYLESIQADEQEPEEEIPVSSEQLEEEPTPSSIEEEQMLEVNDSIEIIKLDSLDAIGGMNVVELEDFSSLSQMEIDKIDILANYSLISPLRGTVTSRFGPRNPTTATVPKYHTGIDVAVNTGTVFIASMSGIVEQVSSEGDYGNHLKIVNGNVMTLYAHCKTIYVKVGERIAQGQSIGEVGETR